MVKTATSSECLFFSLPLPSFVLGFPLRLAEVQNADFLRISFIECVITAV